MDISNANYPTDSVLTVKVYKTTCSKESESPNLVGSSTKFFKSENHSGQDIFLFSLLIQYEGIRVLENHANLDHVF